MNLHIQNETGRLKSVVLGQALSLGPAPRLEEAYDAKSYFSLENNLYPTQEAVTQEIETFAKVLQKHGVTVLRPEILSDYNQVFARDVAFVIDDKLVISNIIEERAAEQDAYRSIFENVGWRNIINLPEKAQVEGGDVIVWNNFIFMGTSYSRDYRNFKTARTNEYAIDILKEYFPHKRIIDLDLHKNDKDPYRGILHLDCTFNPIGKDKCLLYKEGFVEESDYHLILDIFGEENCFHIHQEEMFQMCPNVFSISPELIVTDENFHRMNTFLEEEWHFSLEKIPYREISKMGGLLRCSTMPLVRE